jgi:hypothetical protein
MRFALLVGCLSLTACAIFVTARLRSLNRKAPRFPTDQLSKTFQRDFKRRAEKFEKGI